MVKYEKFRKKLTESPYEEFLEAVRYKGISMEVSRIKKKGNTTFYVAEIYGNKFSMLADNKEQFIKELKNKVDETLIESNDLNNWEDNHFKKRNDLKKRIDIYSSSYDIPSKLGFEMAELDRQWWEHYIKDNSKKEKFNKAVKELLNNSKMNNPKSLMDVPRGVDIEKLYYKISKGYSDKQYREHLMSFD